MTTRSLGPFSYTALHDPTDNFRLLRILPSDNSLDNGLIRCSLEQASLAEKPVYSALSYAWGGGGGGQPQNHDHLYCIEVNGGRFNVRQNLWDFLTLVTTADRIDSASSAAGLAGRLLFVDAICIDQRNIPEKNAQVALMSSIYSNAERVVTWLGVHTDDSERALTLYKAVDEKKTGAECDLKSKYYHIYETSASEPLWKAICALTHRGYWSRVWIVQELLLARDIIVYCGDIGLPWRVYADFHTALVEHFDFLHDRTWPSPGAHFPHGFSPLSEKQINRNFVQLFSRLKNLKGRATDSGGGDSGTVPSFLLEKLVDEYGSFQCTDIRDRIYGLLGLVRNNNLPHVKQQPLAVDYGKDAEYLFFQVLKFCRSTRPLLFSRRLLKVLELDQHSIRSDNANSVITQGLEKEDKNKKQKKKKDENRMVDVPLKYECKVVSDSFSIAPDATANDSYIDPAHAFRTSTKVQRHDKFFVTFDHRKANLRSGDEVYRFPDSELALVLRDNHHHHHHGDALGEIQCGGGVVVAIGVMFYIALDRLPAGSLPGARLKLEHGVAENIVKILRDARHGLCRFLLPSETSNQQQQQQCVDRSGWISLAPAELSMLLSLTQIGLRGYVVEGGSGEKTLVSHSSMVQRKAYLLECVSVVVWLKRV